MEENNVFTGKTLEEAENNAMLALGLLKSELQIEVIEEGKRKLFGSTKWKIRASRKVTDGERAAEYLGGLLKILGVEAVCEAVNEEHEIKIEIKTSDSSRVIGKRGEILESLQNLAGAVANIGRNKYLKVVVDCENYRAQREEALNVLAGKVAQKALDTGRKIILEPMSAYERRIIHNAVGEIEGVKTASEGKEPHRYVAVIPENLKDERPLRYGGKNDSRGRGRTERRERGRFVKNDRRAGAPRSDGKKGGKSAQGKNVKKEIHFGEFLGNVGAGKTPGEQPVGADKTEE